MSYRALVVDDNRGVLDTVSDVLRSLGHEYDLATCQEEARALLAKHQYDYHLLDLEIPVSPERCLARIENGVNLVREVGRVGETLRWDPVAERFTNCEEGNALLARARRPGWELPAV